MFSDWINLFAYFHILASFSIFEFWNKYIQDVPWIISRKKSDKHGLVNALFSGCSVSQGFLVVLLFFISLSKLYSWKFYMHGKFTVSFQTKHELGRILTTPLWYPTDTKNSGHAFWINKFIDIFQKSCIFFRTPCRVIRLFAEDFWEDFSEIQ